MASPRTTHFIGIYGNEQEWAGLTPDQRAETMAAHQAFTAALDARGDVISSSAELQRASTARSVRRSADRTEFLVTDGPFAETAEQLGGFYLVETDDPAGLAELVGTLLHPSENFEIREIVDHSGTADAAAAPTTTEGVPA